MLFTVPVCLCVFVRFSPMKLMYSFDDSCSIKWNLTIIENGVATSKVNDRENVMCAILTASYLTNEKNNQIVTLSATTIGYIDLTKKNAEKNSHKI